MNRILLLLIMFCSFSVNAQELDFGKHQNTNTLVWSDSFDSFVKDFFGNHPGNYFWEDGLLVETIFAALGGPPNDIKKLEKNIILASACRHQSCTEKGAMLANTKNGKALFALIHYRCAGTKEFDICTDVTRTTVFYKDREFLDSNLKYIKKWSERVIGETSFDFVELDN